MSVSYKKEQLHELLYQALETEMGGMELYKMAIRCAVNEDLRNEWADYLTETTEHYKALLELFDQLELDPEAQPLSRKIVEYKGKALLHAMKLAHQSDNPKLAELVAAECIVEAETKDHLNWQLIGHVAETLTGKVSKFLEHAHKQVEDQEDHHLYHTKGWCRELWIASLGLPAVLPPPEEVRSVATAIGASRAEHAREQML